MYPDLFLHERFTVLNQLIITPVFLADVWTFLEGS